MKKTNHDSRHQTQLEKYFKLSVRAPCLETWGEHVSESQVVDRFSLGLSDSRIYRKPLKRPNFLRDL